MLRSRIIPCLLVHKKGLVKTVEFKNPKYVGDPINAVKIFNEKEVDELMVLDIDASVEGREPDFQLIKNIAKECRMPFCYGGGISKVSEAKKIITLGAEKIAISSAALKNFSLLKEIGKAIGVQSLVIVLDVKRKSSSLEYEIFIGNGKKSTGLELTSYLRELNQVGVGEIVVNNIDADGKMQGPDFNLIDLVRENTELPITILGGIGSIKDIRSIISKYKIIGVAAGSLFVFKGKFKAVLINYPNTLEKIELYQK